MPSNTPPLDTKLIKRFLALLSKTLDLEGSARAVGISPEEGTAILGSILKRKDSASNTTKDKAPSARAKEQAPAGAFIINVDGASRGNPGHAGAGVVIKDTRGRLVKELARYLGKVTNNVAEYEALIFALKEAITLGAVDIRVRADSELMVKQINGIYKVKNPALKERYDIAVRLIRQFTSFKISHIRREYNSEADAMANTAIDRRPGK